MNFVSEDVAVMEAHCSQCGGMWADPFTMPWRIFTVTMRNIADGMWTAMSAENDHIDVIAKQRLSQRRGQILDMLGDDGL